MLDLRVVGRGEWPIRAKRCGHIDRSLGRAGQDQREIRPVVPDPLCDTKAVAGNLYIAHDEFGRKGEDQVTSKPRTEIIVI
jgi:hypothetical protein